MAHTRMYTLTCNPDWPEIKSALRERGLEPSQYMHAPDIVVRAFLARLKIFLSDILNNSALGRVVAFWGAHEYTSTMLPHFHLIVTHHTGVTRV